MYFCDDVDLMVWEPGIFVGGAFAHQALVKAAAGTLTGTALTAAAGALGAVLPGMVMLVGGSAGGGGGGGGGEVSQLMEVVGVEPGGQVTVSALRGRADEPAMPGLVSGGVTVTVVSFRPQIAAIGDELLALLGVTSTREDAGITVERPRGFRMACVFGALAAIYRILAAADGATAAEAAQRDFYEKTYADVRRGVRGKVDGKLLLGGVAALTRA